MWIIQKVYRHSFQIVKDNIRNGLWFSRSKEFLAFSFLRIIEFGLFLNQFCGRLILALFNFQKIYS